MQCIDTLHLQWCSLNSNCSISKNRLIASDFYVPRNACEFTYIQLSSRNSKSPNSN